MLFRTTVEIEKPQWQIAPAARMLFVGSCFADRIGQRFAEEHFPVTVNPYGVMYNPASVLHTVERLKKEESGIKAYDVAVLTLGTNHIYIEKATGEIVDNCQKRPQSLFDEQELTVTECADYLLQTITLLHEWNPAIKIILTVSPIRYQKYGFHRSQLSKATLLLAIEELVKESTSADKSNHNSPLSTLHSSLERDSSLHSRAELAYPLPFTLHSSLPKYPGLCTPDESYHGLTYTKAFGKKAYLTKLVSQLMRDLGSIPAPHNSFLLNLGLETLHLRVPQHCRNAQRVAEFLEADPRVAWVHYSGLPSDANYERAQKYLPNGSCGVMAFGLKGTRETAIRFMDSLQMIAIVTHVADARTCVLHPASHTHRQMSDEQLREAGVAPDLIRLSVGIEDAEDILDDIRQALDKI